MNNKKAKIGVLLMIALGVALFFIFDLQRFLPLEAIKASQHDFERLYRDHTVASITAYMIIYILVTAMSLPGTIVYLNAGIQLGKPDSAAGILSHKINCIYRCKQGRKKWKPTTTRPTSRNSGKLVKTPRNWPKNSLTTMGLFLPKAT